MTPTAESPPAPPPATAEERPATMGDPSTEAPVAPRPETRPARHRRALVALRERPLARALLLAALVLLVAGTVLLWRFFGGREKTDDAIVDGPIVAVAARVTGTVARVMVEEGDSVRSGQPLVQIDPHDFALTVARAEADLHAAEAAEAAKRAKVPVAATMATSGVSAAGARLSGAQAATATAEQTVQAAQAHLAAAEASAESAERDVERLQPLLAKDEVSREEFDHATAAAKAARAAAVEARQGVEVARSRAREAAAAVDAAHAGVAQAGSGKQQLESTRADLREAEAKTAQARAALDLARSQFHDTLVVAPADGVVGRRSVEPGETVQRGQPLLAVVPLARIWITANYKETQIAAMRPGQPAMVRVDAYGRAFRGHVASIGAATGSKFSLLPAENASGNFVKVVQRVSVRIVLEHGEDPQHLLRPGMSVVPTVIVR